MRELLRHAAATGCAMPTSDKPRLNVVISERLRGALERRLT
jgi:hypothetical protein